jgi:hypothetical protein
MAEIIPINGDPETPFKLSNNGEAGRMIINYMNGKPLLETEGSITIERAVFLLEESKFRIMRGLEK